MIVSELIKKRLNLGQQENCFFWRDKTGHEVDCLLDKAGVLTPIEIKSGKTITSDYFKDLIFWNELAKNNANNSFVVYGGDKNQKRKQSNVISWKNINKIV